MYNYFHSMMDALSIGYFLVMYALMLWIGCFLWILSGWDALWFGCSLDDGEHLLLFVVVDVPWMKYFCPNPISSGVKCSLIVFTQCHCFDLLIGQNMFFKF